MKTRGLDFVTRQQAKARGSARKRGGVWKSSEDSAVEAGRADPDPRFVAVKQVGKLVAGS